MRTKGAPGSARNHAGPNLTRAPVPGKVQQYVIWERRRVFEWLLHRDDWDKPNFST